MIKTPLSTVIGGAFWTPEATVIGGQQGFSQLIKRLFANGEQGFFYDPNDLSTMFQDAAGTVPVTGAGQPVGLIRDKSGRNNHARQTASASRPILRQNAVTGAYYLEFDGSDDFLLTNNIDFTGTDKVSLLVGVRKLSDVAIGTVVELGGAVNKQSFLIQAPSGTLNNVFFRSVGTLVADTAVNNVISPTSIVITTISQINADIAKLRINGVELASSNSDQGSGSYGNLPLYIGRRSGISATLNGHIYGLIGVGKLVSSNEKIAIEKELAKRLGVTL